MSEVLVVIDHVDGEVKKPTYELLTIAKRLGEPAAVFFGSPEQGDAVAEKVKKYGAVKVYLDQELLAIVKTGGPNGSKAFRVAHFSAPRSGDVRVVTASGAIVRIDGLGVSTYPF